MTASRLVVIGADAAGMSAASQARRRRRDPDDLDIVAIERQPWTSYSACGIPYWVAGQVAGPDALIARTPEQHRANGIDLRTGQEAVAIDVDRGRVRVRDRVEGSEYDLDYDDLVIATGAVPVRPPVPGIDAPGVYGVQTIDDGLALLDALAESPQRAVVVGAGYIGIEMAEAMCDRGLTVTVVDMADEPMSTLDPDMGRLVRKAIEGMGVTVASGHPVREIAVGPDGRARAVVTDSGTYEADLVVLGLGVKPNTALAEAAGLPLGPHGGLVTDVRQRVVGHPTVWSGGDCVECRDRVTGELVHVPLGTHANKQGRVIGVNLGGGYLTFPGVVRTAVSKVCDLEIARTGLREVDATRAGYEFVTASLASTTRAGYFPGAQPMTTKVIAERRTGLLLGAQIVGRSGSAKRIDTAAVALWNGMTVEEVAGLDLAYAPPFSPVWDPVLIAARKAADLVAAGAGAGGDAGG
ncbi:MAG: FAD-dependent oxidoreductase [Candidatus Nanopelagicales bacterium]